jgi:HAD superfamily hydrolase (TIGR01490 family)
MKKGKKPNKIAIFDIDGTIFRKNLHFELINELSWLKVFPNSVRRELSEVYSHWLEHSGTYEDYRKAIVRIYAEHIVGVSETSVREAARIVVPFHARRTYLFSEALLKQLRAEDYHLLAISGSPIEIVEEYNEHYLHFDRVFGSIYTKDEKGVYTGAAEFEPSLNKGEVLQQYVYEHGLSLEDSYAMGDTESDASILRMVTHPIAFNPNQNLKKFADAEGWRIVIEKKDVIYEIEKK